MARIEPLELPAARDFVAHRFQLRDELLFVIAGGLPQVDVILRFF
jgi:hypothetical protein